MIWSVRAAPGLVLFTCRELGVLGDLCANKNSTDPGDHCPLVLRRRHHDRLAEALRVAIWTRPARGWHTASYDRLRSTRPECPLMITTVPVAARSANPTRWRSSRGRSLAR